MDSDRLKAFTDGVVAVIITIMVLEMHPPHGAGPEALLEVAPAFLNYALRFVYVAIYWNNHHHFFAVTPRVNGGVLWANIHLLFWLSLIPFATAWAGEHVLEPWPTAVYGAVLLLTAIAWILMQTVIVRSGAAGEGPRTITEVSSALKVRTGHFDLAQRSTALALFSQLVAESFTTLPVAGAHFIAATKFAINTPPAFAPATRCISPWLLKTEPSYTRPTVSWPQPVPWSASRRCC